MTKGEKKAVLVVFLVCVLLYANAQGMLEGVKQQFGLTPKKETPTPAGVVGNFDMKQKIFDHFNVATSYTHGTDATVYWYVQRSGAWIRLGSGDVTIEVTEKDGGYVYAVVEPSSSKYVDFAMTKGTQSRVEETRYFDIDGDGAKEFAFKYSMANIAKPASGNPSTTFYAYLINQEAPGSSGVYINSPLDITGIGTAQADKFVEWYLKFTNVERGVMVSRVELSINTTDTTKVQLLKLNIPGVGYMDGSKFAQDVLSSSIRWRHDVAADIKDLSANHLLLFGKNQLNKFDFTTALRFTLASGDVIGVTLTIYAVKADGTLVTTNLTDTVACTQA